MIRLSKQARERMGRSLKSTGSIGDMFIFRQPSGTWSLQFSAWDEERDKLRPLTWCFPKCTPAHRVKDARDIIVRALEGNVESLVVDGRFPEYCAGQVHNNTDLERLRFGLMTAVAEKNAADGLGGAA